MDRFTEMTINNNAPAVAASEIEIAADPEIVWDVMTKIDQWPTWNPDIEEVFLDGEVAEGSEFRWKSGPGMIKSTIRHMERARFLAWTGKTLGIKAIHVWRMEAAGRPHTRQNRGVLGRVCRAHVPRPNAKDAGERDQRRA